MTVLAQVPCRKFLTTAASRVLLVAGLVVLAGGCEKPPPEQVTTPVRVEAAKAAAGDSGIRFSAQVTPATVVDVAFRTDGYIAEIAKVTGAGGQQRLLQPGDRVAEGDVLARVDAAQYRDQVSKAEANVDKARAALQKAELDYRRARALYEEQSITGPEYDAARKEFETATAATKGSAAQLDEAQLKLRDTALAAPLDGVVMQREIEIGSLVHAGTTGFVVANTEAVKVVFGVPDAMLEHVQPGAELEIVSDALPDRKFLGTVSQIAPAADQRTRIFEVQLDVNNSDGALRPGMVASLALQPPRAATGEVVDIPISAVIAGDEGGFAVYVAEPRGDGHVAQLRQIEAGQVVGNHVTVLSGLSAGERVVVAGAAQLSDDQPVAILP